MKTSALKAALSVLICVAALAGSARAGKNEASLEAELTRQFVGKTFQIRIVFGNYLTEPLTSGKDCYRLVDTELLPGGGSVRYQVKKGCVGLINLIPSPNHYVELSQITSTIAAGTEMIVKKVEVKDDRIEFELARDLQSRSAGNYAKLKLFVDGGTKRLTAADVVAAAASVIYIEEYEKQHARQLEFERLSGSLRTLRAGYENAAANSGQRAAAGHSLRDALQQMIANRSAGPESKEPDIETYKSQLVVLDKELVALDAAARTERLQSLNAQMVKNQAACSQFRADLGTGKAASSSDWQEKSAKVDKYRQLLEERKNLAARLAQEGGSAEPVLSALARESKDLDGISTVLNSDRKRLQLTRLNASFEEMKKSKFKLLDAYSRNFGTAQERGSLQALISHLQSMLQNRNEARALGSDSAAKEAAAVEAEIAKYKRR